MRAYTMSPSWKILGNLGLSAMKLERYTDGIAAYERYLLESGQNLEPAERQQIEKDLSVMKGTSGTVTLLVTGASKIISASAAPAGAASTSAAPESSDGSNSTLRTTGLIVGGVGVAALIGGGITGFIGLGKKSDFDDRCPDKKCSYTTPEEKSSIESDKDSIESLETLTTALLIGGGVLTATGVTLYVVGGPSSNGTTC